MNFHPITMPYLAAEPSAAAVMRRLGSKTERAEEYFREDWYREALDHCCFRGVWRLLPAEETKAGAESTLVANILKNCPWCLFMAVTAGPEITEWIRGLFASGNGAKAAFADAVASEGVEDAMNTMQKTVTGNLFRSGISVKKARISPGFGDFALDSQPDILQLLDAEKILGITLNNVFFMTPEKSTTALTGAFDIINSIETGNTDDTE